MRIVYSLVLDDYGAPVTVALFETMNAAENMKIRIMSIPRISGANGPSVKFRCYKMNGKRFIDQTDSYRVERIEIADATTEITPMTIAEVMAEDQESAKPMEGSEADLTGLC